LPQRRSAVAGAVQKAARSGTSRRRLSQPPHRALRMMVVAVEKRKQRVVRYSQSEGIATRHTLSLTVRAPGPGLAHESLRLRARRMQLTVTVPPRCRRNRLSPGRKSSGGRCSSTVGCRRGTGPVEDRGLQLRAHGWGGSGGERPRRGRRAPLDTRKLCESRTRSSHC
jgi:hypothetical protein